MITWKEHQWNGEPNLSEMLLYLVNFTCSAERRKQSLTKHAVQLQWAEGGFILLASKPLQASCRWSSCPSTVGLMMKSWFANKLGLRILPGKMVVCWWVVSLVRGTTWLPRVARVLVCLAKLEDHFCPQQLVCHVVCCGGGSVFGLILCDVSIRLWHSLVKKPLFEILVNITNHQSVVHVCLLGFPWFSVPAKCECN